MRYLRRNFLHEVPSVGSTEEVWLGDGLGPVPKKMYEMYKIMARWEFVDLAELGEIRVGKVLDLEEDKVVVLPGFEVM